MIELETVGFLYYLAFSGDNFDLLKLLLVPLIIIFFPQFSVNVKGPQCLIFMKSLMPRLSGFREQKQGQWNTQIQQIAAKTEDVVFQLYRFYRHALQKPIWFTWQKLRGDQFMLQDGSSNSIPKNETTISSPSTNSTAGGICSY